MATAVLPPQYCLPFHHHHRHDSSLLGAISHQKSQAVSPRPPPSSDDVLHHSSFSVMQLRSRNNGASSSSSSSSSSSLFCRPSSSVSRTSSLPAHSPSLRSSMGRMLLSAGRRPFRLVHGNDTPRRDASRTNFSTCLQTNGKSFSYGRTPNALPSIKCSSLRVFNGAELAHDIRKRGKADLLPRRETQNDRNIGHTILANKANLNPHAEGTKQRSEGSNMLVLARVMQKSKTDGILLAELDLKAEGRLGSGGKQTVDEETTADFQKSQISGRSFSDGFSWKYCSSTLPSLSVKESLHGNGGVGCGRWKASRKAPHLEGVNRGAIQHGMDVAESGSYPFSIQTKGGERWAGPAFSNSPPPSSLPLPKFSLKQQGLYPLQLLTHGGCCIDNTVVSDECRIASAPSSPPGHFGACWHGYPTPNVGVDVAFATKDLRRMLHLDY